MSESLVEFLRARLDEDEQVGCAAAEAANGWGRSAESWAAMTDKPWRYWDEDEAVEHIARHSPARVLAEVQAKRQIVALYAEVAEHDGTHTDASHPDAVRAEWLGEVVRLLALPDADHPDYREEWKP